MPGGRKLSKGGIRQRLARLERIIEISRSLNSTLSLRPLLEKIILAAQDLTDSEAGSILLLDRQTGELRFAAATGTRSREIAAVAVPLEGSVAGWVVQHGQPVNVHEAHQDPRFYHQIEEKIQFSTRSLLAVPLTLRGEVIGVLETVNKRGGAFTVEDQETLSTLADQAAIAIENAMLFQQSDLVAEMVHEIRTPLTAIAGYAGMLRREDLPAATRQECAVTIQQEAMRLGQLVGDFLDLARLESGRASLERAAVALGPVVEEVLRLLQPSAEARQIVLTAHLPPQMPPLWADEQRLHQVLVNLVGNGVKYCRPGDRVTVLAKAEEEEARICVMDTGPGIPAAAHEYLFQKFFRLPSTENAEGTGLGLAIARQIVEAHGGRIWVESEEGRGATFCFTIPLCHSQDR